MDLRRLTYFIAVVEEGSISRAADRLHMTQPPLSQAVLALERELGVSLLERHARGVRPTAAGLLLVEQGRNLLHWSERIADDVQRVGTGQGGTLSVASVPTFAWSHLAPILKTFGDAYPDVEVQLADPAPAEVLQLSTDGSADIGFLATSDPESLAAARSELHVMTLTEMPLSMAVAESGSSSPLRVKDYERTTWFLPNEVPGFPGLGETMRDLWRQAGFYPESVQHVLTLQTAMPLVAAGMGVTLLPDALAATVFAGVEVRKVDVPIRPLQATAVWARHIRPSATHQNFLSILRAHFDLGSRDMNG